jgi:hypothetical protein
MKFNSLGNSQVEYPNQKINNPETGKDKKGKKQRTRDLSKNVFVHEFHKSDSRILESRNQRKQRNHWNPRNEVSSRHEGGSGKKALNKGRGTK